MTAISGIHYQTGRPVKVIVADGVITGIEEMAGDHSQLPYIAPGLIDLQVNGYAGIDFNSLAITVDEIAHLTNTMLAAGVTTYFPTVITNNPSDTKSLLRMIDEACNQHPLVAMCVGGIHLEGPFISPQDGPVGAHNKAFVQAPDWDLFTEFQQAAGGRIKIITLSPEWSEAVDFTRRCIAAGIVVAIGHTAATSEHIAAVVAAGATLSTHLGNGSHQLLPRHPNYIWDQLADDRLTASFIGDGFHLPPSVIKVILKVKGDKAVLVSDSVSVGGLPAGDYQTPVGGEVTLTAEGKLHLQGRPETLAGSALNLIGAIKKLSGQGICKLSTAINMASVNAAAIMTANETYGLKPGAPADLIIFNQDNDELQIKAVYKHGIQLYDA